MNASQQAHARNESSSLVKKSPLRVMQADQFYSAYLETLYARNPQLVDATSATQAKAIFRDGFSCIHAIVPYLDNFGCETEYFISNALPLQAAWCREKGIDTFSPGASWEDELLRRRIEWFKPDVLYLANPVHFDARFIKTLTFRPRCIVGWQAADVPATTDWTGYDIILSGLPGMLTLAESLGARKGVLFYPGMPTWVAKAVEAIPQDIDVVFVGSLSPTQHVNRLRLVHSVAEAASAYGFSLALHLLCDPALITEAMRPYMRPPVFGLDMHKALRRGRIVIDDRAHHGVIMPDGTKKCDLGGDDTANMRLFEGTGGGSLVATEYLANLHTLFEPDKELVAYTSIQNLIDKIRYYLNHPEERVQIARLGKARCLGQWNMQNQAKAFLNICQQYCDAQDVDTLENI